VMMSMPSLVYVLGLSGAVHIVNYYRDARLEDGQHGATERALAYGWFPCTLAAFTTAIGLISLYGSEVLPISKFGLYSAIGVMSTLILLFTYLPSALQLWPPTIKNEEKDGGNGKDSDAPGSLLERFWVGMGHRVIRYKYALCGLGAVVIVLGVMGLARINTSVELLKLFDDDTRILADYRWLEDNLGTLVPMEVVVRVDESMIRSPQDGGENGKASSADGLADMYRLNFLERMELVHRVARAIEEEFGPEGQDVVGKATSVATLGPELPEAGASLAKGSFSTRFIFNRELQKSRGEFLATDYLRESVNKPVDEDAFHDDFLDQPSELWRVSLRLGAFKDVDYGQFVSELKRVTEPVLAAYRERLKILKAVTETRKKKGRADGGFVGGRVLVLGAPYSTYDKPNSGAKDPAEDEDQGQNEPGGGEHDIDQTRLFALTLRQVLESDGVKFMPHDPAARPFPKPAEGETRFGVSEGWKKLLSQGADTVVLVGDYEGYDLDFVKQHAASFIDARDHTFVPGSATAGEQQRPIAAVYTGGVPIVYKAQRTLLHSLFDSILMAFGLISVVMIVLLKNPLAGMMAMIPNAFPVIFIFGIMGWTQIMVDIGSMMTASVAMGVAVDDTIHFLTWFRRGLDSGRSQKGAIVLAYRKCATAMTQTTAIGGLGLSVFALSTFTPTQRFGVLMLTLLCAALIGDLILLPALLSTPVGRLFKRKKTKPNQPAGDVAPAAAEANPANNSESAEADDQSDSKSQSAAARPHIDPGGESTRGERARRRDDAHRLG